MIHIENVSFSYPDSNKVLGSVSLDIHTGETVGIVGANGAGKSTFLSLLVGLNVPEAGSINVDGVSVKNNTLKEIRKKVGYVFQNPDDQLFMAKVYDDIAFGPRNFGFTNDEIEKIVNEVMDRFGIGHLAQRPPQKLSGGEKRKVALAAVLALNPEVLLLDEPTSFLDPKGRRNVIHTLNELTYTKIIATHDLDMVLEVCDRVVIFKSGQIVADGIPEEIFKKAALLAECDLEEPLSYKTREVKRHDD